MAFINARLPVRFERGLTAYPSTWDTTVHGLVSGLEDRVRNFPRPRGRWQTGYPLQRVSQGDIFNVLNLHVVANGRWNHFLLRPWEYYIVTNQLMASLGGGSYQLQLVYTVTLLDATTTSFVRKITRPVTGTIAVRVDGTPNGAWTHAGLGVLTGLPGSGVIVADFHYDFPVRFDTDALPIRVTRGASATDPAIGVMSIAPFDLVEVFE